MVFLACQNKGDFWIVYVHCSSGLNNHVFWNEWYWEVTYASPPSCRAMKFGNMCWRRKHSFLWQFISKKGQLLGIVIMVAKTSLRKIIQLPKFGVRSCCNWLSKVARDSQSALERGIVIGNHVDETSLYWHWIWSKCPGDFQSTGYHSHNTALKFFAFFKMLFTLAFITTWIK